MKRRYTLYALATVPLVFGLATTSYGALLLASVVGVVLLSISIIAWIGLFSVSERIAHGVVRVWKAIVPSHVMSMLFRQ